jgi:hypothetical protein
VNELENLINAGRIDPGGWLCGADSRPFAHPVISGRLHPVSGMVELHDPLLKYFMAYLQQKRTGSTCISAGASETAVLPKGIASSPFDFHVQPGSNLPKFQPRSSKRSQGLIVVTQQCMGNRKAEAMEALPGNFPPTDFPANDLESFNAQFSNFSSFSAIRAVFSSFQK